MSFKTKTNLLFIHNPKTGGDFIRKNLGEYTYTNEDFNKRKHEPFTQFTVEGYKPWCVVRNPYTRLESHYNYMKFRDRELCDIVAPTFEQFVLRGNKLFKIFKHVILIENVRFVRQIQLHT